MNRREFIGALVGAAIPIAAAAQPQGTQIEPPLVAVLRPGTEELSGPALKEFRDGLKEAGLIEGENLRIEVRWSGGDNDKLPTLAAELLALKPDVVVTNGELAIRAVKAVAGATPIVMAVVGDPVSAGFVQSLAHPGGNLTGLSNLAEGLVGKRLDLLREAVPVAGCVAVLHNPGQRALDLVYMREAEATAKSLRVVLRAVAATRVSEFDAAFAEMDRHQCGALLEMPDAMFSSAPQQLVALAAAHQIAAIYDSRTFVDLGGLMSYGPDTGDMFRRAAGYVDKILKGAKPGDLPVERPTKFELVINLKTARALGLAIPPSLLASADEVIE